SYLLEHQMNVVLPSPFGELLENAFGGLLTRGFFRASARLTVPALADQNLDGKRLRVLGSVFSDDEITWRRKLQGLSHFLESALIILDGAIHAAFLHGEGSDDVRFDEGARGRHSIITGVD